MAAGTIEKKMLVVDDEPQVLTSLQYLFEDEFEVLAHREAESALRALEEEDVAVILSDQRLPGLRGDQFLARAREVSAAPRVLITGYADMDALVDAVNHGGIHAYVEKPWEPDELRRVVLEVIDRPYGGRSGGVEKPDGAEETPGCEPSAGERPDGTATCGPPVPGDVELSPVRVRVSSDGMLAHIEAVFPDTTLEQVQEVLGREGIVWGIREGAIVDALEEARRTGDAREEVLVAQGRMAEYRERRKVRYSFLQSPGESNRTGRGDVQGLVSLLESPDLEKIRRSGRPVIAAVPGDVLVRVEGEDRVEPGRDVFGKEVWETGAGHEQPPEPGPGVVRSPKGALIADRFGYVALEDGVLSVVPPLWVSPDRMEACWVGLPQAGRFRAPDPGTVLGILKEVGITHGIDRAACERVCRARELLPEVCIPVARGTYPRLPRGQAGCAAEVLPEDGFNAVREALDAAGVQQAGSSGLKVRPVRAGALLAEESGAGDAVAEGLNLRGEPVGPFRPLEAGLEPGANVRREEEAGEVRYVSEIYGYAGVSSGRLCVLPPLWTSPDEMETRFVALAQEGRPVLPVRGEMEDLLERAQVRYGIDPERVASVCREWPGQGGARVVQIARGTPPQPGRDGRVDLLFDMLPDPDGFLKDPRAHMEKRSMISSVQEGALLGQRAPATPGVAGTNVRGEAIEPRSGREAVLLPGKNVTLKKKGEEEYFYAIRRGWARVVRNTVSVMQRFRNRDDLSYSVRTLRADGDVEICGSVRHHVRVQAAGDVYIAGNVEPGAQVTAGGRVVVKGGVVGARVHSKADLFAGFVEGSQVQVEGDLRVRRYVQDSQVQVFGRAVIQVDEEDADPRGVQGGLLVAGAGIRAETLGDLQGRRETRVVVGLNPEIEARLKRYRKEFEASGEQAQKVIRALESAVGEGADSRRLREALERAPSQRREALVALWRRLQALYKLRVSLRHHLEKLEKQQAECARQARIHVLSSVFAGVSLQVGKIHQMVEEEMGSVVFRLSPDQSRIVSRYETVAS